MPKACPLEGTVRALVEDAPNKFERELGRSAEARGIQAKASVELDFVFVLQVRPDVEQDALASDRQAYGSE